MIRDRRLIHWRESHQQYFLPIYRDETLFTITKQKAEPKHALLRICNFLKVKMSRFAGKKLLRN